jgi:hypothetical protein
MAVSVPTLVFIVTRLNRRADPLPTEYTHRGRIRISSPARSAVLERPPRDRNA